MSNDVFLGISTPGYFFNPFGDYFSGGYAFQKTVESKMIEDGAKNVVKFEDGSIWCNHKCGNTWIMPDIADVSIIESDNVAKVVIVSFRDGTTEKAVLSSDDTFNLEQGISICITKRLLSDKCKGHGNSVYNKIVRHGLKVYENAQKKAVKNAEEAERIKAKMKKLAQKKAAKRAKREAAEREYLIGIQAEAYARAMRELNASAE